jgi:hypothetical protein
MLLTQYGSGNKTEKHEVGGACSTYGVVEAYTGFWWRNVRERDHLEDPGTGGRMILR